MTSILLTVIFLLADGSPAKDAVVSCPDVTVSAIGSDRGDLAPMGTPLVLDARGAFILEVPRPRQVSCWAAFNSQRWGGFLRMDQKVQRIYLIEYGEE